MKSDVVLVDILEDVVNSMSVTGIPHINYEPGRSIQILKSLNYLDQSITLKDTKYPLVAVVLPAREFRGSGYYSLVKIDRIVIATITNSTDDVLTRYKDGGTFKSILYPCYYEFLNQLARSTSVIGSDPDKFTHVKMDNPGVQPIGQGLSDYIDSIEILNLEITLTQFKTC